MESTSRLEKKDNEGLPWQCSGQVSTLPLHGAWVQSCWELRCFMLHGAAKTKVMRLDNIWKVLSTALGTL